MGCGTGFWGWYIKSNRRNCSIIGIDGFEDYTHFCRSLGVYCAVHDNDIINYHSDFKYDYVLLLDVLEHLKTDDGIKLISYLKVISNNIILATPDGFIKNDAVDGNKLNIHLSGWSKKMLSNLGFSTSVYDPYPKLFRPFVRLYNYLRGRSGVRELIGVWRKV